MPSCSAYGCTNRPSKQIPGITFHRFPLNVEQRHKWILAVRRKDWLPSKCSFLCSAHFSEDQIDRTSVKTVRLRQNAVPNIFKGFSSHSQKKKKLKKQPSPCIKEDSSLDSSSIPYSSLSTNSVSESSKFSETDECVVKEGSLENKDLLSDSSCINLNSFTNSLNETTNFSETDESTRRESSTENKYPLSDPNCTAYSSFLTNSPNETSNFSETDESTVEEGFSEIKLLKRKLNIAQAMVASSGEKIRTLQQKNKHYKNKIKVLVSLLGEIKEKKHITDEEFEGFLRVCVSNKQMSAMFERASNQESCSAESLDESEGE